MASRTKRNPTLDLFSDGRDTLRTRPDLSWPEQERVPLNLSPERRVRNAVEADLRASSDPLAVTGFASLDELIEMAATYPAERGTLRFLLGQEPFATRRDEYRLAQDAFPKEVQEYWLARGFSLLLSGKLVTFMQQLKAGRIQARCLADGGTRLHAKIYCGDEAVTVGSSNFTRSGLDRQLEANVRFTRTRESKRYGEVRAVAENYWATGSDYKVSFHDGFTFVPYLGGGYPRNQPLRPGIATQPGAEHHQRAAFQQLAKIAAVRVHQTAGNR